jgi:hypothetical protein
MRITRNEAFVLFTILILVLIPLVSAEITISQPEQFYSKGNQLDVLLKVTSPLQKTSGFLTAKLFCEGQEVELYKSALLMQPNEVKEVSISTIFGNFLVGDMEGKCFIRAQYGEQITDSPRFVLSSEIDITLEIEGIVFGPGDPVYVYGVSKKKDGFPLDGFIEVKVPNIEYSSVGSIASGTFDFNFTVPIDAPAGDYTIEVHAYDKDETGGKLNQGSTVDTIKVKSVVKKIEIALASQTVIPNTDLSFTVNVYDQSGVASEFDVPLTYFTPNGKLHNKQLVKTGEPVSFFIESNFTPGYWKVLATVKDLEKSRNFFVEEYEELSFKLEDQILTLSNLGNIPYNGPVEISIGEVSEIKELIDLPVGSLKQYKLLAPNGEYEIRAGDGTTKAELGKTFLTGGAIISVEDIGGIFGNNLGILISILIILIIAVVGLYLYRKFSKNRTLPKPRKSVVPFSKKEELPESSEQLSTVIDSGEKQASSIITIKIKNQFSLQNQFAAKALDSALWKAKEAKAKVYVNGDFRIIVFAPKLTGERDNTLKAIRIAQSMERILNDFNRRAHEKIEFGIGINFGDLIVGTKEGRFKFMSTDNTISIAKNVAQVANNEALISEKLHRVTAGKVKTEKLLDKNVWRIKRVTDRSDHDRYLKNLKTKR